MRTQFLARALFVPIVTGLLTLPVDLRSLQVGVAHAQEDKLALGIVGFGRRGDVGVLLVARIEEYLRQMLDAGGSVRLLPPKVVETGRPLNPTAASSGPKDRPVTAASRALDKADTLAVTARSMMEEGEDPADILKLLLAAAQRYEQNYVELVDFTKLVDVYAQAATAALLQRNDGAARDWVAKALTLQPTFVVDARKSNKQLQTMVTASRQQLAGREPTPVTVECNQPDCDAYVDGVKIGATPATVGDLFPGIHYVQARKPGAKPWGMTINAKGKPITVSAKLEMEEDPANQIGLQVDPADMKGFADSGKFGEKMFKNSVALFTRQVRATHLLYGVVARSTRGLELHLFLVNGALRKTCALEKVEYNSNLSDLQMKTLDAEGRVRSALGGCAAGSEVRDVPEVYARPAAGAVAAPTIVPTPPTEPEPEPTPDPEPRRDARPEPKPDPKPEPKPEPRPEPRVVRSRPEPAAEPSNVDDPYAGLLTTEDPAARKPFYKTAWFWTSVGVVAAAGAGTGLLFATRPALPADGFRATAQLP